MALEAYESLVSSARLYHLISNAFAGLLIQFIEQIKSALIGTMT